MHTRKAIVHDSVASKTNHIYTSCTQERAIHAVSLSLLGLNIYESTTNQLESNLSFGSLTIFVSLVMSLPRLVVQQAKKALVAT